MTRTIDSEHQFAALFIALPWQILEIICRQLPPEIISDVLLKVPSLRPFIVSIYYSDEIRLYLVDPDTIQSVHNFCDDDIPRVIGLKNVQQFLATNTDIVPKRYIIYPDLKYVGLEELLRSFQDTFSKAQRLQIEFSLPYNDWWFRRKDPSKKLMDLIFSFRNLSLLSMWYLRGNLDLLSLHRSLENFVLHALGDVDWTCISLPSSLKSFDLRVEDDSIFRSIPTRGDRMFRPILYPDEPKQQMPYDELYNLLWKSPQGMERIPDMARCPSLAELTLKDCRLDALNFDLFPPTLTLLSLLGNKILFIESYDSAQGSPWPENLKTISLSENYLPDSVVYELSEIGWPSGLESLILTENQIRSLKCLFNLPSTLRTLYLDENDQLTDLNFVHDGTGFRIACLPDYVQQLMLSGCEYIEWGHLGRNRPTQISERLHLPPDLTEFVYLSKLRTTEHLVFPPSLKTLKAVE